jgi:hypothetical protein
MWNFGHQPPMFNVPRVTGGWSIEANLTSTQYNTYHRAFGENTLYMRRTIALVLLNERLMGSTV